MHICEGGPTKRNQGGNRAEEGKKGYAMGSERKGQAGQRTEGLEEETRDENYAYDGDRHGGGNCHARLVAE